MKPYLGEDGVFVAGHPLQGGDQIRVRAVEVGRVEGADAAVVGALEERFELLLPHPRVVGLAITAVHASADAEAADLELGLAERDGFVGVEEGRLGFRGAGERHACQDSAQAEGGSFHELTALYLHRWEGCGADCVCSAFILWGHVSTPLSGAQLVLAVIRQPQCRQHLQGCLVSAPNGCEGGQKATACSQDFMVLNGFG